MGGAATGSVDETEVVASNAPAVEGYEDVGEASEARELRRRGLRRQTNMFMHLWMEAGWAAVITMSARQATCSCCRISLTCCRMSS